MASSTAPRISIVIPVYNEEAILHAAVVDLRERLSPVGWAYEVILAENGSKDKTVEIAEKLAQRFAGPKKRAELDQETAEDDDATGGGGAAAVTDGDLAMAERLLGRGFSLSGRVGYGQQLGRQLGFPTANLRLHPRAVNLSGIYAVRVRGIPGRDGWADAVASLGTRPTVGGVEPLLEVHVFDYAGNLYGRRLEVEFVARLRDEERFDSLPALVAQMEADAQRARQILAARAA
jgi:glycosyltransferase involved in cell wall biosynthesis